MDGARAAKAETKVESRIPEILKRHESEILNEWMRGQLAATTRRADLISEADLREESRQFLRAFQDACQGGSLDVNDGRRWAPVREQLARLSANRVKLGFSPAQTATFVFSLKEPLFQRIRQELARDPEDLARETWLVSQLIDSLGLYTIEAVVVKRDEVIARQQQDMLELSTPVVTLWQDVLALPLIGTLDSARTQVVMESLLNRIVETGARIAILDITGVPTVDTLVAQHLLKTIAAARLMGADCLISGIRPQIAQTIVHLGVDLGEVTTKATMAEAFATALARIGHRVVAVNGKNA